VKDPGLLFRIAKGKREAPNSVLVALGLPPRPCPTCGHYGRVVYVNNGGAMDYAEEVATMPSDLDRIVLQVLQFHRGAKNSISREGLVAMVNRHTTATDRQVRLSIRDLRRQGHLVCGMAGADGGYYLAADKAECDAFLAEFTARVSDIAETAARMRRSAERAFGEGGTQTGLFA